MKGHKWFMEVGESYTDSLCTGSVFSMCLDCAFLLLVCQLFYCGNLT